MSIAREFLSSSVLPAQSQYLHAIVEVLNNAFDEIFPASELAEVVESGEKLELLQEPDDL